MRQHLIRLLSLACLITALFGWLALAASAQDDDPGDTPTAEPMSENGILDADVEVAIEPTGENGYCTICHSQPLRTLRLEDGSLLNLYVAPEMIVGSVHGPTEDSPGLGCLDCHGEDAFPHSGPPPADGRVYTLDAVSMCTTCHTTQADDLEMGLHAQAIADGNLQAAVCTDCHGAHHVQSAEFQPQLVAGVCGDCHEATLEEWQISPHADIGPLGCASCHDHHAQTLRAGENSTELCINCHNEMPSVFVHDTHNVTDGTVACAECHMYTGETDTAVSTVAMNSTGHSMLLDSTPCTTCHEQLVNSGEWAQIISNRYDVDAAAVDSDEVTIEEAAVAGVEEAEIESPRNAVFVLQGLLVGLGLGLTFAIVFVTRSMRRNS